MKANKRFRDADKVFWANVRSISEALGYTSRTQRQIRVYSTDEMVQAMSKLGLSSSHLVDLENFSSTLLVRELAAYFKYRAEVLNSYVESRLMDSKTASRVFYDFKEQLLPTCPLPFNKQTGDKKAPNYLTGLVNMLIEANAEGLPCDYNPRSLTTITKNNAPLRTFARRVDGCFPNTVNPIAIWEIKEYYYTTTFGSRVADGIYETLLDGLKLEELYTNENIFVQHLLMVDSHFAWWEQGKSYLCRLIDMLNMGYVDEVLFGYEVVEQLPTLVKGWVELYREQTMK